MEAGFYHLITAAGKQSILYCNNSDTKKVVSLVHKMNGTREPNQRIVRIESMDGVLDIEDVVLPSQNKFARPITPTSFFKKRV